MNNQHVFDWLRDAHSMEEQAEKLFSGQAERLSDYKELSARLKEEVNSIEENKALLSKGLKQRGGNTSLAKDSFAKIMGFEQNMAGKMVSDEPVKGVLALYSFTQMAVGSYRILVAAADATSDTDLKSVCQTLLSSSERRAAWIEKELEPVTRTFLNAEN
ncbi:MAG: DUF892 family protein [Pseudohongiella sp.]|nr:DUF892 family protein [Pseudohongiella sp.]MDP2125898.1 DUF892 family protein [Pseudohongiella sp.]